MTTLQDQYAAREDVVEALSQDVLGPSAEDEALDEGPLDRYIAGVLYPAALARTEEEPDDPDAAETGGSADGGYDPGVALSRMKHPSSMGLSFTVDLAVTRDVTVTVSAGRYEQLAGETLPDATSAHSRARRPRGTQRWQRVPAGPLEFSLNIGSPAITPIPVAPGWAFRLILQSIIQPA